MKLIFILLLTLFVSSKSNAQAYIMPSEETLHEGTWLQWPHQFEYGIAYRNSLDATWVAMTKALVESENVHIIAYNNNEKNRIISLLTQDSIDLAKVDFRFFPTNDVWVRDNGPIFVRDSIGQLTIEDWGFNGWGGKFNYTDCDPIPSSIANKLNLPLVNLNNVLTIEGGAYEIDGNGVFISCRSSTLSQSPANSIRNPGMTQQEAEVILSKYLGIQKFIWLDGYTGTEDITDAHIDGFAKFANDSTILTMNEDDLVYWGLSEDDISILNAADNIDSKPYKFVFVPLTSKNVVTTYGKNLGFKGSYCNYYIANSVVLVPNYSDPNDAIANAIIQDLHPGRTVVGIDCRNLYEYGGMVHCVTQQQPSKDQVNSTEHIIKNKSIQIDAFPNPSNTNIRLAMDYVGIVDVRVYNQQGVLVYSKTIDSADRIDISRWSNGLYYVQAEKPGNAEIQFTRFVKH